MPPGSGSKIQQVRVSAFVANEYVGQNVCTCLEIYKTNFSVPYIIPSEQELHLVHINV